MRYTGRTRRWFLLFTQYEYEFRGYVGGRWQYPGNSDRWPLVRAWTFKKPAQGNSRGLIDVVLGRGQ